MSGWAFVVTAALDAHARSAWCREHGLYGSELDGWRQGAIDALADPEEARATPQATRADKRRIHELERDLLRKDRALAETTALLVLAALGDSPRGRGRRAGESPRRPKSRNAIVPVPAWRRPVVWQGLTCAPGSAGDARKD